MATQTVLPGPITNIAGQSGGLVDVSLLIATGASTGYAPVFNGTTVAWAPVTVDLSSYLTIASAASTYATISSLSSYETTSHAASTYLAITTAASTYATIASLSSYLTTAAASSTYATQAALAGTGYVKGAGTWPPSFTTTIPVSDLSGVAAWSPTFTGLTISSLTASRYVVTNGSKALTSQTGVPLADLGNVGGAAGDMLIFDGANWIRLAVGPSGYNIIVSSGGLPAWAQGTTISAADRIFFFGDGSDGPLNISSGVTTLTKDTYYSNVTLSGTAQINCAGYRLFVNGILDLTNAAAFAIVSRGSQWSGTAGATAGTAGTAGTAMTVGTLGVGAAGGNGGAGGTAAGSAASATGGVSPSNGGYGGNAPNGSAGTSGAGGAGSNTNGAAGGHLFRRPVLDYVRGVTAQTLNVIGGGAGGGGGGGGGGDGTAGGGGGGGGAGSGGVMIWARKISRSASTAAKAIAADGGNGGAGGSAVAGTRGGGAGGAGGGAGWVQIAYEELLGSTGTNIISASGGNGGSSGNATTGTAPAGGGGGAGGYIATFDLSLGTSVATTSTNNVVNTGGAASGLTGGTGATGVQVVQSL